ncbi:hypothetical protein [Helicobacter vulpis]|uniref:hypothetical protein n=1 Tax=Helicobacter vulpis TaxID=2316076 RepID=UPI000EB23B16|nr:hypothetical protein [Helicobacter vulpis]
MHVAEVVEITRGVLKSAPCVRAFSHVSTDPKNTQGGLFIALHPQDIAQALACGAYGVLYDQDMGISDPEIAWIFVPQVAKALERLLRYHLLGVRLLCVDAVEFAILSRILHAKHVVLFEGESVELLNLSLLEVSCIVAHTPAFKSFFEKELDLEGAPPFQILLAQLFNLSVLYQGVRFDLKLPSFYAPQLARALLACEALGVCAQLDHLGMLPFMRAFYTNDALEPCAHGCKVLVGGVLLDHMRALLDHTRTNAPWHHIEIFTPTPLEIAHQLYCDLNHLKILLRAPFTLGFVLGGVDIGALLACRPQQGSLFG